MQKVPLDPHPKAPLDWTLFDHPGWQQFVDVLSTGISVYDENMHLVAANAAFYRFTGLAPDQHLQKVGFGDIVQQLALRNWYGETDVAKIVSERTAMVKARKVEPLRISTPFGQALDIRIDFPPQGGFITFLADVTDLELEHQTLREAAIQDPLTKLPNRRCFDEELDNFLALGRRTKACGALILYDLDGFKALNDTLGHPAGDRILIDVGAALAASIREVDLAARLGGDEFAVIVRGVQSEDDAETAVRRIDSRVREAVDRLDVNPRIGITAGAALSGPDESQREALIDATDGALYAAKKAGKGRLAFANTRVVV